MSPENSKEVQDLVTWKQLDRWQIWEIANILLLEEYWVIKEEVAMEQIKDLLKNIPNNEGSELN
jgi:hypothetical protein